MKYNNFFKFFFYLRLFKNHNKLYQSHYKPVNTYIFSFCSYCGGVKKKKLGCKTQGVTLLHNEKLTILIWTAQLIKFMSTKVNTSSTA